MDTPHPSFCTFDDPDDGHAGAAVEVAGHDGRTVRAWAIWRPGQAPRTVLALADQDGAPCSWVELDDDACRELRRAVGC